MRVVFATSIPFTQQHEVIMYTQTIGKKYPIEKLDLSAIYGNSEYTTNLPAENAKKIQTLEQLEQHIQELLAQDSVLVITDILIPNLKAIYPLLKKYRLKIVTINKEIMGGWLIRQGQAAQGFNQMNFVQWFKGWLMLNPFTASLIHQLRYGSCQYDYILASANLQPEAGKEFVQIHHVKYDEYLQAKNSENPIGEKYILFIDSGLTTHPMLQNAAHKLDHAYYLNVINQYLDLLEQKYKLKVVVSVHPSAAYEQKAFGDKLTMCGKTPELVEHCEFVVSHGSTSLINAILARKPMKILTSKAIEHSASNFMVCYGLGFAKLLGLELVDLDHPQFHEFSFDPAAYSRFETNYLINAKCSDKSNEELIYSFLQQLENEEPKNQ